MDIGDCPAWIDPGNAFRLVVKVAKYVADGEYGLVEMSEQQHDLWLDRSSQYSVARFHEDLASKIIWGPSQTLAIWVLDQDTGSEWKVRRDEHFKDMIRDRWNERIAFVAVDVVRKGLSSENASSSVNESRCFSGVTSEHNDVAHDVSNDDEGFGDTYCSPSQPTEQPALVDWATLTIEENPEDDGLATQLVDEDKLLEAMGFKAHEAGGEQANVEQEVPIPAMTAEMQQEMNEAAVDVDDTADEEPLNVRRHVVYLPQKICTCRQWQVTGKPCPHALTVITSMRQPDMGSFVDKCYSVQKFQAAYAGIIPNITDREQWPQVDKGFKLHPPLQKPRKAGRLRKNRMKPSSETGGKPTRQVRCPNCQEYGHRSGSSNCSLTGTKKRKRTKKKTVKAGRRKKANTTGPETLTPRTRGALAREAAAKAKREAEEAEMKAAAAREAAEAAAREEIEATRLEGAAHVLHEEVLEPMALEVLVPDEPIGETTAKRALFTSTEVVPRPQKKMTPRKKQLATKVKKKTPEKKRGKGKSVG